MLKDSMIGLAIGIFVISSIAWVSQWRRIRERMKTSKAMRAERESKTHAGADKTDSAEREARARSSEWPI